MKTFSPVDFSKHLLLLVAGEALAMHKGLEIIAKSIEKTAKSEIGRYQKSVGPFPKWADLMPDTVTEKEKLGYAPPDNPLLRTGELRDSIGHQVEGLEAVIGSTSQLMVYHEFGTSRMAMRPVLGPAAFRNKKLIQSVLGRAVVAGFYGNNLKIHESLGYEFETSVEKD